MKKLLRPLALFVLAGSLAAAEPPAAPPSQPPALPQPEPAPAADKADQEKEQPAGTKAEQLTAAQKQLSILKLRHDAKHPAVVRQRAKVVRLQQELRADQAGNPASPRDELAVARSELADLRTKFTDEHPRVKTLQRRIAELEKSAAAPAK